MATPPKPKFSEDQKAQLRRLGFNEQQIESLGEALPRVVAVFRLENRLPVSDVRDELQKLQSVLRDAAKSLNRIQNATANQGALNEALTRTMYAEYLRSLEPGVLSRAHDASVEAVLAVDGAIAGMPAKPTRRKTASVRPIRIVHDAIVEGWIAAHSGTVLPGLPEAQCPSSSLNSAFRQVIGVCYEAAGRGRDCDPERAIKAYLRNRKAAVQANERRTTVVIIKERTEPPSKT